MSEHVYQCPICKKNHDDNFDAMSCLQECLLGKYSVETKYLCPFCGEKHDEPEDAWECAAHCYLEEHSVAVKVRLSPGGCSTCTACDASNARVYPCPHRHDAEPPDYCDSYDVDVRHFGTGILTEYQQGVQS